MATGAAAAGSVATEECVGAGTGTRRPQRNARSEKRGTAPAEETPASGGMHRALKGARLGGETFSTRGSADRQEEEARQQ